MNGSQSTSDGEDPGLWDRNDEKETEGSGWSTCQKCPQPRGLYPTVCTGYIPRSQRAQLLETLIWPRLCRSHRVPLRTHLGPASRPNRHPIMRDLGDREVRMGNLAGRSIGCFWVPPSTLRVASTCGSCVGSTALPIINISPRLSLSISNCTGVS